MDTVTGVTLVGGFVQYAYYGLGARDYGTDRKSCDLEKCQMNRAPSVVGQSANTRHFAKVAMEDKASGECCEDRFKVVWG